MFKHVPTVPGYFQLLLEDCMLETCMPLAEALVT